MAKPPPKPVKPGKGGARRVPRPPRCPASFLCHLAGQTRPGASLSRCDPPGEEFASSVASAKGEGDRFG